MAIQWGHGSRIETNPNLHIVQTFTTAPEVRTAWLKVAVSGSESPVAGEGLKNFAKGIAC